MRRTLTAKDGRKVDAELLAKTENTVKIRRKADAAEFTIELEKLSDADRKYIQASTLPILNTR